MVSFSANITNFRESVLCLGSFTRVLAGYLGTSHTKDVVLLGHKDTCAISEKVLPDRSVMHILGGGQSRVDSLPKAKLQEKKKAKWGRAALVFRLKNSLLSYF